MYYIIFNINTGEIEVSGECPEQDFQYKAGNGKGVLEANVTAFTHYVKNNTLIAYTEDQAKKKANQPDWFYKWSNETFEWIDPRSEQEKYNETVIQVKQKRESLLASSDWTQLNDVLLNNKDQWVTYRQSLRDIPEQSGYPFNVIWPTKPE